MSPIDFADYEVLTFDCYGTLIDWETGLLASFEPVLAAHGAEIDDEVLLEVYGAHEAELEAGPYLPYAEVVAESLRLVGEQLGFTPTEHELRSFAASVTDWPAFDDSTVSLRRLSGRYRLGVIMNCDDELFAASNRRLGVEFDTIVTAEQARIYKPSHRIFELALEQIDAPRDRILHVAQSLYHDHVPARALGLASVWIDRRAGRPGAGATPTTKAQPDLTVPDLRTFAELACAAGP